MFSEEFSSDFSNSDAQYKRVKLDSVAYVIVHSDADLILFTKHVGEVSTPGKNKMTTFSSIQNMFNHMIGLNITHTVDDVIYSAQEGATIPQVNIDWAKAQNNTAEIEYTLSQLFP